MQSCAAPLTSPSSEVLAAAAADLAEDLKAQSLVTLDVRGHCSYADYLVICSGTSDRHVRAIAEAVERGLEARGATVVGREGFVDGQWALLDVGGIIVHVFHPFTRQIYSLEDLWRGRPRALRGPQLGAAPQPPDAADADADADADHDLAAGAAAEEGGAPRRPA